jgi:hypothetical protein
VKVACEAIVVRYIHDLATEEFVNVGVLLFAPSVGFSGARFLPSWVRVTAMFPDADHVHLKRLATTIETKLQTWTAQTRSELPFFEAKSLRAALPEILGGDELGFRPSASAIRGLTSAPEQTLTELFDRYVGKFITQAEVVTRDDHDVWRAFAQNFPDPSFNYVFQPVHVRGPHLEHEFSHGWKNGVWNAAQPLSFDLVDPSRIRDKATAWVGRVLSLHVAEQNVRLSFLLGMPGEARPKEVRRAARDAKAILEDGLNDVDLWDEGKSKKLIDKIARDTTPKLQGSD